MVAGERTTLDFAYAGDIIGVINPGVFAIGDTISLSGDFNFKPLPQFQPEIFARVHPKDIGKRIRNDSPARRDIWLLKLPASSKETSIKTSIPN